MVARPLTSPTRPHYDSETENFVVAGQLARELGAHLSGLPSAGALGRASSQVRRLTPIEAERLQGFPDGFTCLCGAGADWRACACPDSPRYRALGNAVTVPVTEWLGTQLKRAAGDGG